MNCRVETKASNTTEKKMPLCLKDRQQMIPIRNKTAMKGKFWKRDQGEEGRACEARYWVEAAKWEI